MKRSTINHLISSAHRCFKEHGWTLPPNPRWDVTDFGLGNWKQNCLVLVNLAEHKEYCEKLMYAKRDMVTPMHCHHKKKEDIISRWGTLRVKIQKAHPEEEQTGVLDIMVNNEWQSVETGSEINLHAGERITLEPHVYHAFWPVTEECIIGEVSTANDDLNDNFFINPQIGRYPHIEEDEPAKTQLLA